MSNCLSSSSPGSATALLGLGSNLGDRRATLASAVSVLRRTPGVDVLAVSAVIETEPVGVIDQPRFLNAAVKVSTTLAPRRLLETCLAIERDHGRERTRGECWQARTLDIDLLLYGEQVIDEPGLSVPHARFHERVFALQPAAEIAGQMVHPAIGRSIGALLRDIQPIQPAASPRVMLET